MTVSELNDHFGLAGVLVFEEQGGLQLLRVSTPACSATVYLHGAHLTDWTPAGFGPVLFLSGTSHFAENKAIRGGVPICWPWFGPRWDDGPNRAASPAHGFARTATWEVGFAALVGEDVHLTLALGPSDTSRALGYDDFRLAFELQLGARLRMRLTVFNTGQQPLVFEEALHSYFRVTDVRRTTLLGLDSANYLDKTDGQREKETAAGPLQLSGETDRVFPENVASVTVLDGERTLTIDKSNSATTVVWNPWAEKAAGLDDLAPNSWPEFVCVEVANTGSDRITLPPSEFHSMDAEIYVARKGAGTGTPDDAQPGQGTV